MATILIIEDISSVMLSLRIVLEGAGHSVRCAPSGDEGLNLLRRNSVDLVVTDIWMPGMPGSAVIAEGRRIAPATRFLAITGGAPNGTVTVEHLQHGREDFGADRVLFKPFQRGELLSAIEDLTVAGTA